MSCVEGSFWDLSANVAGVITARGLRLHAEHRRPTVGGACRSRQPRRPRSSRRRPPASKLLAARKSYGKAGAGASVRILLPSDESASTRRLTDGKPDPAGRYLVGSLRKAGDSTSEVLVVVDEGRHRSRARRRP